jgi:hypothetical protein
LSKIGFENSHGCAQNIQNSFNFDFLQRYYKDDVEFLNHIVQVTDGEAWVSFVNIETKEQSKQWMPTHSPSKLNMFKQTSFACQKADAAVQ